MLLRQDFGRSHQGPLPASTDGAEQRGNRHNRFTGAHIPLDQPGHGFGTLQISLDLSKNPLLRPGEGKGQQGEKICHKARGW